MRERAVDAWRWLGALPAFWVVVLVFAAAFVNASFFSGDNELYFGFPLAALLVAYCGARPTDGWGVFGVVSLPASTSEMLSLIGIEKRPVALALIPVSLIFLWAIDHPDDDEREDDRPSPPLNETPQPGSVR